MPRTAPVPPTETPGLYNTSALFNAQVRDLNKFALAPPIFSAYQAPNQSIPNNAFTSATLDTERVDSDAGHSTVTNTSRYTFQVAGWYLAYGVAAFTVAGAGARGVKFLTNGTTAVPASEQIILPGSIATSTVGTFVPVQANVGDYLELQVFQNSGGVLSTNANLTGWDWATSMSLFFISN